MIMQIMRIHAYETDFRQRVRAGDGFEFFFDMKDEDKGIDGRASASCWPRPSRPAARSHKFYRFRTPDGTIDYYDAEGNTSRKFLMRRPVRGEDVRITSGFGLRRHPAADDRQDALPASTGPGPPARRSWRPATASSRRSGAKGEYGNYIRIRHANGYKTAYGHMSRFAHRRGRGRQGAAGPDHRLRRLHGPVVGPARALRGDGQEQRSQLHVDPMSIQVPHERQLTGKELADFQRERARIDDLMRTHPVAQGWRGRAAAAASSKVGSTRSCAGSG